MLDSDRTKDTLNISHFYTIESHFLPVDNVTTLSSDKGVDNHYLSIELLVLSEKVDTKLCKADQILQFSCWRNSHCTNHVLRWWVGKLS